MPYGVEIATGEGLPQGGPLSPSLSNVVLNAANERCWPTIAPGQTARNRTRPSTDPSTRIVSGRPSGPRRRSRNRLNIEFKNSAVRTKAEESTSSSLEDSVS